MSGNGRSTRYAALDVFRGLTIVLMIMVNYPGAGADPWPVMDHAPWFGFTLADLVFPSFQFAMGASLVFVMKRPMTDREFLVHALRRAALLFLIGFLEHWYPFWKATPGGLVPFSFTDVRVLGVLQRLAICYALAAPAARFLKPRQIVVLCLGILAIYWAVLVFFADPGQAFDKTNNIGSIIDRALIARSHLYTGDGGFEPEGLLGNLPATVNVLAGYLTCRFLVSAPVDLIRIGKIALGGVLFAIAGLAVSVWFPLSKKLWSDSFVLLTIGIDLVLIGALAAALDWAKLSMGRTFFEILGKNPLAIYVFSDLVYLTQELFRPMLGVTPYDWVGVEIFQRIAHGPFGSFLFAIAYTSVCCLFGYILHRKNVFIRL